MFNNTVNAAKMNAVDNTKRFQGVISRGVKSAYFSYLFPVQFCFSTFLSFERMFGKIVVSLGGHIAHVFKPIAKFKMVWIDAERTSSTGAAMENHHAVWNRADKKNPRSAMGVNLAINPLSALNHAVSFWPFITARSGAPIPNPMIVSDFNFLDKPLGKGNGKSLRFEVNGVNVWLHNVKFRLALCRALGYANNARASLFSPISAIIAT